jgi:hypothetical protein
MVRLYVLDGFRFAWFPFSEFQQRRRLPERCRAFSWKTSGEYDWQGAAFPHYVTDSIAVLSSTRVQILLQR